MFEIFFLFLLCANGIASDNSLSTGISKFTMDLYQKTVETNHGNVIMSPYSVATALGLLSAGTKGLSFDQIRHGLHLSGDKNTIANEFSESINSLKSKIGDSKLDIANKIYLQTGLQFKTEYKTIAVSKFNSDIETTNFAETEQTANKINHWVEEKTNDRIKNLIEPKALDPVTQLMLVNAIYFKGAWEKPFKYLETTKKPFWTSESHSEEMDFMNKETYFEYGHFDVLESSALKMKYSHSDSSLLILLPDKVMGLTDLEKKLHNVDIKTITGQMRQREIEISIPKFKIEFETEMKETLIKLGISDIFTDSADLSDILNVPARLKVSRVIHKAFFEVNEEGAEAAASTGLTAVPMSLKITTEPEPKFIADHPFLFFILRGDEVLFVGSKKQ